MTEQPCVFPGCVSQDRHWHGPFPGGYENPADPDGPPIEFTTEPEPGVRDYNGALLRGSNPMTSSTEPTTAADPESGPPCYVCGGVLWPGHECAPRLDNPILHWPHDPRVPNCNEHCHRAEARQQDASALRTALEWLEAHADHALSFHRGWGPDEDFPEPEPPALSCASCEKEYVLAALPPSTPPGLDVERLRKAWWSHRRAYHGTVVSTCGVECSSLLAAEYARD